MVSWRHAVCPLLAAALALAACSSGPRPLVTDRDATELVADNTYFPWRAAVIGGPTFLAVVPGGTWEAEVVLEVDLSRHDETMGRFRRLVVAVYGERRFDEDGGYRSGASDYVLTSNLTAGGMPIASRDSWPRMRALHDVGGSPFEAVARFELPAEPAAVAGVHRFEGRLVAALPADLPRGWWQLRVGVAVEVDGVAQPLWLEQFYELRKQVPHPTLPLVEVGPAAPAHIPWTAFASVRVGGRSGALPEEAKGRYALVSLTGFPGELVLPPGRHRVGPSLPMLHPAASLPVLFGPDTHVPSGIDGALFQQIEVTGHVDGPGGREELGTWRARMEQFGPGPRWDRRPRADLTRTGTYEVRLAGHVIDRYGRRFPGGGTYRVHVARPLSFSTSCKPGMSFLTGGAYPAKVNVNPAVPAEVQVTVDYYPQSDAARRRTWTTRGRANRFGHFTPSDPPLRLDEPGEYVSEVRATYRDRQGLLWMGVQLSTGVIAPAVPDPVIRLRPGSRSVDGGRYHAWENGPLRYEDHVLAEGLFLQNQPPFKGIKAPGVPQNPSDTLFMSVALSDNFAVEPRYALDVRDARLARRLRDEATSRSYVPPRAHQRRGYPWVYLEDVIVVGTSPHGLGWTDAPPDRQRDLPITPVSRGPWHPVAFPDDNLVDAWVVFMSVRPGIPVLTGLTQRSGKELSWTLNPNPFGNLINAGYNGDLPGDVYLAQAGVMLRDRETGAVHYDVHSSSIVFTAGSRPAQAVLPPGARPLVEESGRQHWIFLATDTHDALAVGEDLAGGGVVFPNVPADVTWVVTTPSGDRREQRARADRRGAARAQPPVPVEEPGVYQVQTTVRWEHLEGGIPGTSRGDYWVCGVAADAPALLVADLPPVSIIGPDGTARIPLRWPAELEDVRLWFGTIMPGAVLEQGVASPPGGVWTYEFTPAEIVRRFPNFDVRQFATGLPELADTAVFQFCLEARDGDRRVVDGLRLTLRADKLFNARDL